MIKRKGITFCLIFYLGDHLNTNEKIEVHNISTKSLEIKWTFIKKVYDKKKTKTQKKKTELNLHACVVNRWLCMSF